MRKKRKSRQKRRKQKTKTGRQSPAAYKAVPESEKTIKTPGLGLIQTLFVLLTALPCAAGILFCSLNYFEISRTVQASIPIIVLGFGFMYAVAAAGFSLPESWELFQFKLLHSERAEKKPWQNKVSFALKEVVPLFLQWFGLMSGMLGGGVFGKIIHAPAITHLGYVIGYLLIAGLLFIPGILLAFLLPMAWEKWFDKYSKNPGSA